MRNKRIGILGLAFEAGTDDLRESPAIEILKALLNEGYLIRAFDPIAMLRAREELRTHVTQGALRWRVTPMRPPSRCRCHAYPH
ncbi:MAG TPA: UDP binding domain-containing protein [Terracidiphilus sp.]